MLTTDSPTGWHKTVADYKLYEEATVYNMANDSDADIKGFIERLRAIPDRIIEAKQRAIERVRHLLIYDMSGSREDAFTSMMRQLVTLLAALPRAGRALLNITRQDSNDRSHTTKAVK